MFQERHIQPVNQSKGDRDGQTDSGKAILMCHENVTLISSSFAYPFPTYNKSAADNFENIYANT